MTLLGIVGAAAWGTERIVAVSPGQTVSLSGYDLNFDGVFQQTGPNYNAQVAKFTVREGGAVIGVMEPQKRNFSARETSTNEAALMTRGVGQIYLSLGDSNKDGSLAIRLYYKPLVMLIWLGGVVMMLGGALSLSDRRLRVGAPKPAARSALQPAE
jgi:cytochrome c-type biogenesis protein CcmF